MVYTVTMLYGETDEQGYQLYWINREMKWWERYFKDYPQLEWKKRTLNECAALLLSISEHYEVKIKFLGAKINQYNIK